MLTCLASKGPGVAPLPCSVIGIIETYMAGEGLLRHEADAVAN